MFLGLMFACCLFLAPAVTEGVGSGAMEMGSVGASVLASVRASVRVLLTRYLENGLADFDHTSPVDLYGQSLR
jgi:hypothetical protein